MESLTTSTVRIPQVTTLSSLDRFAKLKEKLGSNISERRKSLGFTQAELAERMNVDVETISRFERGKHLPPLRTLDHLAQHLRFNLVDLLQGTYTLPSEPDLSRLAMLLSDLSPSDQEFTVKYSEQLALHLIKSAQGNKRKEPN